jgi:alpha-glucosidase
MSYFKGVILKGMMQMMNSSYAVKPELYHLKKQQVVLEYIEEATYQGQVNDFIHFITNKGHFYIGIYESGIRLIASREKSDFIRSFSLEPIKNVAPDRIEDTEEMLIIHYKDITLRVDKHPFGVSIHKNKKLKFMQQAIGFNNEQTYLILNRHVDDWIYGLGEKTGFLNKNNDKTINWNSDVFEPHTRSNKELYQSINMFTHMHSKNKYGLFIDNASKITFDFDSHEHNAIITTDIGEMDYYVYTGDTIKEIIMQHAENTGKTYLPPMWALGYHQSRHSYESVEELEAIYNQFKTKEIPVDAIYLDILYMERYKVFSFNQDTYARIGEVIKQMKEDGVRIVPIVDPGVKVEKGYPTYEEGLVNNRFCKDQAGLVYIGEVWPGKSAFYDFMDEEHRKAWGANHKFYTDLGIEGIWNDMNEPSVFRTESKTMDLDVIHHVNGKPKTHREMHNLYGLGMSMATYEGMKELIGKRPFVLTRAGYAGIQKYATVWTGDNRSSWEHLEMTLPMCLNLGLSGVSLSGPDIGGFMDDSTEELLIRWIQMGTFLPFFRNHCSIGLKRQEPWEFGERAERINKKYIRLRYQLLRFIYSEVFKSHQTGLPVMRPLVLEFEDDPITYSMHDQFMLGSQLLIAPIMRPGETYRKVYLPKGIWYNFFTNQKYDGNQWIIVKAELDEIPVFVKAGSVIPTTDWAMNADDLSKVVTINVYLQPEAFTEHHYFDDGMSFDYLKGDYGNLEVNWDGKGVTLIKNGKLNDFDFEIKTIK